MYVYIYIYIYTHTGRNKKANRISASIQEDEAAGLPACSGRPGPHPRDGGAAGIHIIHPI